MNNRPTTSNKKAQIAALFAVSLVLTGSGVGQAAFAQGMEAGSAGSYSPMSGLGPDQESFLPPEVVPLDPSAANKLLQSQAQARAAQMSMPEMNGQSGMPASPGMLTADPMTGMQSAQDARKAAFDQLMGQNQAMPSNRSYQNQFPGNQPLANQFPGTQQGMPGFTTTNPLGNPGYGAPMQGQMANNYPGPGSNGPTGQSGWVQPGQGGTQTLTGGVKNQPVRRDIRRAGISNALSGLAGLGTGLFLGSLVNRSMYTSPAGLAMFGLGATGFGVRNGFRF